MRWEGPSAPAGERTASQRAIFSKEKSRLVRNSMLAPSSAISANRRPASKPTQTKFIQRFLPAQMSAPFVVALPIKIGFISEPTRERAEEFPSRFLCCGIWLRTFRDSSGAPHAWLAGFRLWIWFKLEVRCGRRHIGQRTLTSDVPHDPGFQPITRAMGEKETGTLIGSEGVNLIPPSAFDPFHHHCSQPPLRMDKQRARRSGVPTV